MRHIHIPPSSTQPVLHCTVQGCLLGHVLIAASAKGIAAVLLGDSPQALLADLQQRYPAMQVDMEGAWVQCWSAAVLEIVNHPQQPCDVPVDTVCGTDFQRKVWSALRMIAPGQTRTYAQVAQAIGQPLAVRAVAGACAANPVAVLVPCHRVLRSDGGWGGYRWGVERKQQLLAWEAA